MQHCHGLSALFRPPFLYSFQILRDSLTPDWMRQSAMQTFTPTTAKGLRLLTAIMSTLIVLVMLVAMAALKRNSVQTRPTVDVQTLPGPVDLQELANGRAIGPLGMVVAVPS